MTDRQPLTVTRNADGSYSPAYDETWPPLTEVEWSAGVASIESGLTIRVIESGQGYHFDISGGRGSSGLGPMSLSDAYAFLEGVRIGAQETARRLGENR
ncbi:hypothetical protein XF35_39560 [Streptomyces platensis subsp. clarensis]|uniref:Uncharacterized protein n=1 Tax=Streptomyces showdoensis TaxID=68268 RepID=A0A2P2GKU1_STREW|nr:hypothetical protein [Streptomyces showdoensis]KKZ72134.1 hypothetical protein VO63_20395 [Streptomyces showdoensis]MCW7991149.1 hypothetical protein [Streptomyces platensis subsp. clarensis]